MPAHVSPAGMVRVQRVTSLPRSPPLSFCFEEHNPREKKKKKAETKPWLYSVTEVCQWKGLFKAKITCRNIMILFHIKDIAVGIGEEGSQSNKWAENSSGYSEVCFYTVKYGLFSRQQFSGAH